MDQYIRAINDGIAKFSGVYELDTSILEELRSTLLKSGEKHITVTKTSAGATTASASSGKTPRRRTAYNSYIKARFEESKSDKEDTRDSQKKMTDFSKEWKELPQEEKDQYLAIANEQNESTGKTTKKGTTGHKRAMTGYNLFYRENKDRIRKDAPGSGFMKAVGEEWRGLSDEDKKVYNERAKDLASDASNSE